MLRATENLEILPMKESHSGVTIIGEFPWEEIQRNETIYTLVSRVSLPFRSLPYKSNTDSQKHFGNSIPT